MVRYRRNRLEGGTYFFTVTLMDRRSQRLTEHIDDLRAAYMEAQRGKPFETVAIVVLPDHLHAIWTLPAGDADYSGRWRLIGAAFSHAQARADRIRRHNGSREFRLWQRRFWEHTIRDENDLRRHVDYIHFNPVKHKLANRVSDWPFSSFHKYVQRGDLPSDWAAVSPMPENGAFGE